MKERLHFSCKLTTVRSQVHIYGLSYSHIADVTAALARVCALLAHPVIPTHLCMSWTSSLSVRLHNWLEALAYASYETTLPLRYHGTLCCSHAHFCMTTYEDGHTFKPYSFLEFHNYTFFFFPISLCYGIALG